MLPWTAFETVPLDFSNRGNDLWILRTFSARKLCWSSYANCVEPDVTLTTERDLVCSILVIEEFY